MRTRPLNFLSVITEAASAVGVVYEGIGKNVEKGPIPSFEEGAPRRFNDVTLPLRIGAAGEVRILLATGV